MFSFVFSSNDVQRRQWLRGCLYQLRFRGRGKMVGWLVGCLVLVVAKTNDRNENIHFVFLLFSIAIAICFTYGRWQFEFDFPDTINSIFQLFSNHLDIFCCLDAVVVRFVFNFSLLIWGIGISQLTTDRKIHIEIGIIGIEIEIQEG